MDGAEMSAPAPPAVGMHSSRPTLGFPVGTALLIFVIFSLSGIFSGCYHWEKIRAFRQQRRRGEQENQEQTSDQHISISIPSSPTKIAKGDDKDKNQGLPVIMPGDPIPKFIAMPCPCQLARPTLDDKSPQFELQLEHSIRIPKKLGISG
ncbi:hydroxyproline-rich glycoprotein family protein [Rhynchospora pubera]|uniref:Hydroxyproline-rich glycoprotein family protein n=1 Tax=Rhynchospora pubera TaxID=906938 RepID=A0AAV8E4S0_9POAL|nr:hydroxyproline-rich glycoprotein family protein [Rhynchospora pubera]KAJ4773402.1 hydroxyproline-rich glycoprotein family protein [Rhynchospora pubera]KAJ4778719.1 hydroxyproline-rich glycoprotein family protein [Rhynchospora pubera]KAJ4785594.1 hydroxyproline-rich glycoprotein family protein [Rhynchospora pubera]